MAVNRFLTEAKSIAAINHPNIVQIYDYGRANDGPFLVMEFVDGGSLLDRCRDGALPLGDAVDLACQLCDGLAKAHDLGIIHRDIKPANVLLTKDGIPKLADFGLAKASHGDRQLTVTGKPVGTPDFMPPEQRRDASLVDHRSDLWSLAATLYQMVTGRSPKIIRLKDVPDRLEEVLAKALEEDKSVRYQTAREFRDALKSARDGGSRVTGWYRAEDVLQEGQCKACGTVTSDLTKKFCRNPQCGASLRAACLKCDAQMPVWDGVCGECGGNQPALLEAKRKTLEAKRAKAEALLADLAFDEAIGLANEAASESRTELADLVDWAHAFVAAATVESDRQHSIAVERMQDAKKHVAAWDYPAAIQSLEMIPHRLRDGGALSLLSECQSLRDESEKLLAEIASRIGRKEIEGLLPLVERAVELRGDRADLAKIRQQLTERRDVRLARAWAAMASGDVKAAAAALGGMVAEDLGPDGGRLLEQMKRRQEQARDDALKQAAERVQDARKHVVARDYPAAIPSIEMIPHRLRDAEVLSFLSDCHRLREESETLLAEIARRCGRKEIDGLLPLVERAAGLLGDREDLTKIREQLTERCEIRLARARAAIDGGDAKSAAAALAGAFVEDLGPEGGRLLEQVRQAAELEDQLAAVVKDAKADGVVNQSEATEIRRVGLAYLAINPRSEKVKSLVEQCQQIITPSEFTNSVGIKLKLLRAGSFRMGPAEGSPDETPYAVTLTKPFYMGVHQVTNAQWVRVMWSKPSHWNDPDLPVEQVSWDAAVEFCEKLSALPEERAVGRAYRLPTEAEWEYACRAGTTTHFSFGDDEELLGIFGWYDRNSSGKTHLVRNKKPNGWGLYDMHGNVWEWCSDWYGDYPNGAVTDPKGPSRGSLRVRRGGSWLNFARKCGAAYRGKYDPSYHFSDLGFRLALHLS